MKKFDARAYSIADFLEWHGSNLLDLSPKFQRRSVWTRAAKSFLIDTVLRGKPMPKVLLTQDLVSGRNVRTVVDGQQRIRTILEFIAGSFAVMRSHNETHHSKRWDQLDDETKASVLKYEIGVDLLYDVSLAEMLDIFARINTYSVTLNRQEKLNAKYLGVFKTVSYELGHAYASYWMDGGVVTEKGLSRMAEAELASDLLVALVGGIQTIKNIEKFYKKFEYAESIPTEVSSAKDHFISTMSWVGLIYPANELSSSNWSRPHWFYTLFTSVAHALKKVDGVTKAAPPLNRSSVKAWRFALDEIGAKYDEFSVPGAENVPVDYAKFIDFAQRRTPDTEARRERTKFVIDQISA